MVPSMALFCLGLGPILADAKNRFKKIAFVLLILGGMVQCITLATSFMEDQAPRGHYYDATWTYRLGYSLSGQIHLLLKYLKNGQPTRLGLGWDRWFVFLHNGGISTATLAVLGLCILAGLGISLAGLAKCLHSVE
jgi:hypothetical protein